MVYPFYFDPYTILLILPALILGLWAQSRVRSAYRKYSGVYGARGYTGAQVARAILDQNGLQHVGIERIPGELSDHFDPRLNIVRLSQGVHDSPSLAAVGVAAHECGHAVQYAQHYAPLRLRSAIIPITNIGSKLAVPLILVGFLLRFTPLIYAGIIGYALIALFQLITLPVEFNASSRAMAVIDSQYLLDEQEQRGAQKVLQAAALTYVAALAASLAQLLRLLLIVSGGNRSRR